MWRRSIIVEALTEYDRREARRLRDWLRVNASLLSVAELDFQLRRAEHDIATAMAVDVDQAVVAIGDALHAKWPLDTTKVLSEEDTRRES